MTRRLLFKYALGSTTGAGGIGAAEAAAGAGAGALVDVPQLLHELQPVSQPVSQQDFLAKSFDKSPFFLPQPQSHPQGSQALISHPQVGALHGSQAFTSQPQVGAAPQPQPVSQQLSQPLPMLRTLQAMLRRALSTRPNSSISGLRRGLQHVSHVAGPQLFISQPQLGAAPQGSHALTSQPQDGPFSLLNSHNPSCAWVASVYFATTAWSCARIASVNFTSARWSLQPAQQAAALLCAWVASVYFATTAWSCARIASVNFTSARWSLQPAQQATALLGAWVASVYFATTAWISCTTSVATRAVTAASLQTEHAVQ